MPLAYAYDVDPYHLCVIFLLNLEMGFLIPPVGMNLFISSIRFGKPIGYVTRSVIPFLLILTVTLGIVTYVPWISTYLPSFVQATEEGVSLGGGYVKLREETPEEAAEAAAALEALDDPFDDLAADDDEAADASVDGGLDGGAPDTEEPTEAPAETP
jgi:hypothetical protein